MGSVKEAFRLKKKAIAVIEEKGVYDSINWIVNQRKFGKSDQIENISDKSAKHFDNCQKYFGFTYKSRQYELFFENEHSSMLDGDSYYGDVRLVFDGQVVFKTSYSKESDDWRSYYSLVTSDQAIEVLRLDDWVEELSAIVSVEKEAAAMIKRKLKKEKRSKEAKKIEGNFDLGKYQDV